MYFEEISCPICYSEFDNGEHIPRVIPTCGHTLCLKCILILLQSEETRKCPLDKKQFANSQENEESFPINYVVKSIIEKISSQGVCKEHKQLLNLICETDNCKVCEDCVFHGEHKSHKIETLRNFKMNLGNLKDQLISKQKSVQKFAKSAKDTLNDHRKDLLDLISLKFEKLRSMLIQKEVELFQELNFFFDHETFGIDSMFGQESKINQSLKQGIAEIGERMNNGIGIFRPNEQEILMNLPDKFEEITLKTWSSNIAHKIEEIKMLINSQLFQETLALINKIDLPKLQNQHGSLAELLREKFNEFDFNAGVKEEEEKFRQKPVQLMTSLKLNPRKDYLEIIQKRERNLQSLPDETQFKELRYEFRDCILTNEDKSLIGEISTKCFSQEAESIKLLMHNENISDEGLLFLFPLIFWKTQDLQCVEVNLRNCSMSDSSVVPLIENYFYNMNSLSHLNLNLNHTKISPKSLKSLSKLLKNNLSELKLYLYNTEIDDGSICDMLRDSTLNLKTLVLSLTYTEITDKTLYALVEKVIKNKNHLETIELYLGQTQITDHGMVYLIQNLPLLKAFKLGLEYTKVTDNIIPILQSSQPIAMKSLRMLDLFTSDTLVSQTGQNQLIAIKNNLLSTNI